MEAYGPYAASATGGNGFARDLLAGISALYAKPLYRNVGRSHPLVFGSLILACICCLVIAPIFLFFFKGPYIREHSKFSKKVLEHRREVDANAAAKEKDRATCTGIELRQASDAHTSVTTRDEEKDLIAPVKVTERDLESQSVVSN